LQGLILDWIRKEINAAWPQLQPISGGGTRYYPGAIEKVHDDGTYTVLYDDGDKEASVPRNLIRVVGAVDGDEGGSSKISVGSKVEAKFGAGEVAAAVAAVTAAEAKQKSAKSVFVTPKVLELLRKTAGGSSGFDLHSAAEVVASTVHVYR
jgi:hypothetical protein